MKNIVLPHLLVLYLKIRIAGLYFLIFVGLLVCLYHYK